MFKVHLTQLRICHVREMAVPVIGEGQEEKKLRLWTDNLRGRSGKSAV